LRDYKCNGPVAQAFAGLTATSGLPGREPAGWGFSYMDHMGATMNAAAIVMALMKHRLTGRGDFIDAGQSQHGVSLLGPMLLDVALNGAKIRPAGNRDLYRNASPNNAYRCHGEDAWVVLSVRTGAEWQALCATMGLDALAARPELEGIDRRVAAEDEIDAAIAAWTATRDRYEVMAQLQDAGIAAAAVQHVDDKCLRDPQLAHRGFYQLVDDPLLGRRRYESGGAQFDVYDSSIRTPRPLLGADTRAVLRGLLGYSDDAVDDLLRDGVIAAPEERETAVR